MENYTGLALYTHWTLVLLSHEVDHCVGTVSLPIIADLLNFLLISACTSNHKSQ